MDEKLLITVKEINPETEAELSVFGETHIVSHLLNIYSVSTDVKNKDKIRNIQNVLFIEKDYIGYLV